MSRKAISIAALAGFLALGSGYGISKYSEHVQAQEQAQRQQAEAFEVARQSTLGEGQPHQYVVKVHAPSGARKPTWHPEYEAWKAAGKYYLETGDEAIDYTALMVPISEILAQLYVTHLAFDAEQNAFQIHIGTEGNTVITSQLPLNEHLTAGDLDALLTADIYYTATLTEEPNVFDPSDMDPVLKFNDVVIVTADSRAAADPERIWVAQNIAKPIYRKWSISASTAFEAAANDAELNAYFDGVKQQIVDEQKRLAEEQERQKQAAQDHFVRVLNTYGRIRNEGIICTQPHRVGLAQNMFMHSSNDAVLEFQLDRIDCAMVYDSNGPLPPLSEIKFINPNLVRFTTSWGRVVYTNYDSIICADENGNTPSKGLFGNCLDRQ